MLHIKLSLFKFLVWFLSPRTLSDTFIMKLSIRRGWWQITESLSRDLMRRTWYLREPKNGPALRGWGLARKLLPPPVRTHGSTWEASGPGTRCLNCKQRSGGHYQALSFRALCTWGPSKMDVEPAPLLTLQMQVTCECSNWQHV